MPLKRVLLSYAPTLMVEFRSSMGCLIYVPNVNMFSFNLSIGKEDALSRLTKYRSAFDEADEIGWLPLHKAAVQLNKNILEITLNGKLPLQLFLMVLRQTFKSYFCILICVV